MTRRIVAAVVLGAAAGYLARSQLSRRMRFRRALQPHGRLLRDAALIAAVIQPGETYQSVTVAAPGRDYLAVYSKDRGDCSVVASYHRMPDDVRDLEGER